MKHSAGGSEAVSCGSVLFARWSRRTIIESENGLPALVRWPSALIRSAISAIVRPSSRILTMPGMSAL